jgi:hypothetical protein
VFDPILRWENEGGAVLPANAEGRDRMRAEQADARTEQLRTRRATERPRARNAWRRGDPAPRLDLGSAQ